MKKLRLWKGREKKQNTVYTMYLFLGIIEVKMFWKKAKIASDNTIKNSLINFDIDFTGLKDIVTYFFPTMRHELVLRYRAETIAKIGFEAYNIAQNEKIQINPIPPKIALPLIERMSLENEPDMYEKWAKLLIAAGVNPNPIQQQYADILSNLNSYNANFLMKIYLHQMKPDLEKEFDEFIDKSRFRECYEAIKDNSRTHCNFTGTISSPLPDSFDTLQIYFNFPYYIIGTNESKEPQNQFLYSSSNIYHAENTHLIFTKEENDMLIGLKKLGLIKYQVLPRGHVKNEYGRLTFNEKCGVLLTLFGFSFVDCLEHPIK